MEEVRKIRWSRRKLKSLVNDSIKTAEAANLVYVNDSRPGIIRIKNGNEFIYKSGKSTITNRSTLSRIRSLVIPPAWSNVWICDDANGHLQVTGFDIKGRKQYKYHPAWNELRNETKYFHLHDFGKALTTIREQLKKDLALPGLPLQKVLATVVSLMECTCIRIGSSAYERMNGSFGLTTLKDQHVKVNGHKMMFSFKGKKGVYHNISFKSRKLARIVQACRDIPGKELFQYFDGHGERRSIDSGMVNNYIKQVSRGNFTTKDFRTWAGTIQALRAFKDLGQIDEQTDVKKRIVEVLDIVARLLGNTRTVCKKYYVHPAVVELYSKNSLADFFNGSETFECNTDRTELSEEEMVLLRILEAHGAL